MILLCGFQLKFRRKNSCEQATRHFSIFISEKYKSAFSWIWNRDRWSLSGVVIFVRLIDIHTSLSSSPRKIHIFSRMSPGGERLAPSWFFLPVFVAKGGAFNLSPSPWAAPSPVIVSIIIRRHRVDIYVRIVAAVCLKKRTNSPFFLYKAADSGSTYFGWHLFLVYDLRIDYENILLCFRREFGDDSDRKPQIGPSSRIISRINKAKRSEKKRGSLKKISKEYDVKKNRNYIVNYCKDFPMINCCCKIIA